MNAPAEKQATQLRLAPEPADLPVVATSSAALILDGASMDSMMRLADIMAKGRTTIPDHLKGSPSDCGAIIMQAIQWRLNPYAVAQKTHIVNGALGYEAQLVNSVIQSSGVTQDRFHYEWFGPWERIIGKSKVITVPQKGKYGDKDFKKEYQYRVPDYKMEDEDGCGIHVKATLKGETEPRVLTLLLVQASVRNSPLWATDPKQQLAYLAVKRWTRLYAPDVILGVYTPDELEEVNRGMVDITPGADAGQGPAPAEVSPELVQQAKSAAARGVASYQQFWTDTGVANRKALATQHEEFKAQATAADQARTIDAEPAEATTANPELEGMAADLLALAEEDAQMFADAWTRLSKATKDQMSAFPELKKHADAIEVAP